MSVDAGVTVRPGRLAHKSWMAFTLSLVVAAGGIYVGARAARRASMIYGDWQAMRLNQSAWKSTYEERRLPLPDGPRDGWWGSNLGPQVRHPQLGWVLPELHLPGRLEIDAAGMQHVAVSNTRFRVLILGASVAFGGYASRIENTYFAQLAELLARGGVPADLTVYATGAWKSVQELEALRLNGLNTHPDVVLFLNGLNDLTNGSNARTLYGVQTRPIDGSRWHPLYSERDYGPRVSGYMSNMKTAYQELRRHSIPMIVALQPALFEKRHLSAIEKKLERDSLKFYGSKADLLAAYEAMRRGLRELASQPHAYFIDCSRPYNGESLTVFTDIWHFSDAGHALLASTLGPPLIEILSREAQDGVAAARRGGGGK